MTSRSMLRPDLQTAWDRGFSARRCGSPKHMNPYNKVKDQDKYKSWEHGWLTGMMDGCYSPYAPENRAYGCKISYPNGELREVSSSQVL